MNASLIATVDFTNATIVAALVAGFAAVIGGLAKVTTDYRLKKKEFRVTQIKSRIDTLEQAVTSNDPEPGSPEVKSKEDSDPRAEATTNLAAAAFRRLDSTDKQYTKYKWLLDPQFHLSIASMLKECIKRRTEIAMISFAPSFDSEKFHDDLGIFIAKTQELQNAYEDARLSTIERLYRVLNKEVGISLR